MRPDDKRMAAELAKTRGIVLGFAATRPGFVGINPAKGAKSVEAIIEDLTRTVAYALDLTGDDYKRFVDIANGRALT